MEAGAWTARRTETVRDDRILPATHRASLVVPLILVPALVILSGLPYRTADAWAWTVGPDLTPIFLGAGYGAGAYFFLRTFLSRQPRRRAADRRDRVPRLGRRVHRSPFAVSALWWLDRQTDPGRPAPGEAIVPERVRFAARLFGAGALAAAAVFLLSPQTVIDVWGWQLTPLTARILGCFTAQVGVGALWLSTDRRWSAWRLIVQTFFVATALLLVGAVRAWDDSDLDRAMTWLPLGGLVAGGLALLVLLRSMRVQEGRRDGPAV